MAKKRKKSKTKGKSLAYLKKKSKSSKATVKTDARKITAAKKDITAAKKRIDTAEDFLNKANGYRATNAGYKTVVSQIDALNKKKAATKSKAKRKKYDDELKKLNKQRVALATQIRNIAKSAGYSKYTSQITRARKTISNANKHISDLKKKKSKDTHKHNVYRTAFTKKNNTKNKKLERKNSKLIQKKIKKAKKAKGLKRGFTTAVYRADLKSSKVFLLGESSPSETNEQNLPTHPVDKSDPRLNYGQRSSKQVSATYYMHGKSFSKLDSQYDTLQRWARETREVHIRGFARWKHAYLSSVGKSMDEPYRDTLPVQLTFQYAMKAHIKYAKKTKKKAKPKASKKKGTHKSTKKYVRVKSGMTYWAISRKYHVSIKSLEKMNKWPARSLPIGAKVRYA